jgi:methyl-accepting chemotaxis protein
MNFAHPINEKNLRKGILVIRQQTDDIELPLQGVTGIGQSFDAYLVNKDSIRLTPVLLTQQGAMERVNDANTENCLTDYRINGNDVDEGGHFEKVVTLVKPDGRKVYATHDYVPEMGWCVMTEVDEQDALNSIIGARPFFMIIGCMLIIVVYFISLWVGAYISKPIEQLGRNVELMLEGDFDHSVSMEGKDDVSKLSHIIESIRLTLRKFRDEAQSKKDNED